MMGWICEEEYWIGLVISGWYMGDIIWISPTYHPDGITHMSPYITHISRNHPYITHIIQISPTYHQNIIHISPTYRINITQSIFFNPPTWWKVKFYGTTIAEKKTPLWNSIKTPLLIIQILPKYHPNIIRKSSKNHPKIIQKSFRYHPVIIQSTSIFTTPQLGEKSSFHPRYGMNIAGKNFTFKLD